MSLPSGVSPWNSIFGPGQGSKYNKMIRDIFTRVTQDDPVKSDWCISGQEVTVWADSSSLATGVVVAAEDVTWLQLVHEDKLINLAELDAVL